MVNLYTSDLLSITENPVDILIDQINIDQQVFLEVLKYSAQDELIGAILPPTTYVENGGCPDGKTRIRVFLDEGQLAAGEKLQVKLNN